MKRVLIVASVISFIEWFEQDVITCLSDTLNCEVHIACNCNYMNDTSKSRTVDFVSRCQEKGIVFHNIPFVRTPFSRENIKAYKQVRKLILFEKYDIVHCHTPMASILTRLASRRSRRNGTKVIYTAHGFHFYNGSSVINWLLYYPIELLCSCWTDEIITINSEDFLLAKSKLFCKSVDYIPGVGIDVSRFKDVNINIQEKRKELEIDENTQIIFSVGELNDNKNHISIIRALSDMKDSAIVYMIAGKGDGRKTLEDEIDLLGMSNNVKLLGFRLDIPELYKISDLFVFPSYREGLPASIMEAMASGLPVVCSEIRGNTDLIDSNKGGYLCKADDIESYKKYISTLLLDDVKRCEFGKYNQKKIDYFSKEVVLEKHIRIYQKFLGNSEVK